MDGYTVEEAASVLGVPRERVWELLARGILSGSTDLGGSMRVRLKSDSAAAPSTATVERPTDPVTGPSAELTPFRELLTEFRSLTERYGQALLALGEARGEVAGLRSRVDMLEARVDLRLPSGAAPISSSWSATPWPIPSERVVEPPSPRTPAATRSAEGATTMEHDEADASRADADEGAPHRRRPRAGRRATERFADALARAQDPSIPELPGAAETAAALAAMRQEHPPEGTRAPEPDAAERDADASLPRELPSADQVPVADEAEVPAVEAVAAVEAAAIEQEAAGPADAGAPDHVEVPQPESVPAAAPEAPESAEPAVEMEVEPAAAADEPGAGESELAWDPERYSAAIEEPGWISADDVPVAPTDWVPPRDARPLDDEAAAEPVEAAPDGAPAEAGARVPSPAAAERQVSLAIESSGSRELDEGLAALDALAHPQPPIPEASEDALETSGGAGRARPMEPGAHPTAAPRSQVWARPSPPLATRSSASRAYRRLRRIFPT